MLSPRAALVADSINFADGFGNKSLRENGRTSHAENKSEHEGPPLSASGYDFTFRTHICAVACKDDRKLVHENSILLLWIKSYCWQNIPQYTHLSNPFQIIRDIKFRTEFHLLYNYYRVIYRTHIFEVVKLQNTLGYLCLEFCREYRSSNWIFYDYIMPLVIYYQTFITFDINGT